MTIHRTRILAAALLLLASLFPLPVPAGSDIQEFPSCAHCGMSRKAFDYSRMLVTYDDGNSVALCSLSCAANELAWGTDRKVVSVKVADYDTKELIEAAKAVWVVGGSEWGVMTRTPKWAFSGKDGAEAFVRKSGGAVATWEEALAAATEERSGKKPSGKSEGNPSGKVAGGKSGCCCCGK